MTGKERSDAARQQGPTPDAGAVGADPAAARGEGSAAQDGAPQKPAILQDAEFTVEEGFLYRFFRTGAIFLNKLFFAAVILWVVWLFVGTAMGDEACTDTIRVVEGANGTAEEEAVQCSVWLSTTSLYLGAMAVLTFLLSTSFGLLGLVVGKNILEVAKAEEELGAGGHEGEDAAADAPDGERDGPS